MAMELGLERVSKDMQRMIIKLKFLLLWLKSNGKNEINIVLIVQYKLESLYIVNKICIYRKQDLKHMCIPSQPQRFNVGLNI